jgi:transposase
VPKACPGEFRRDVIAVAYKGEAPIRQVAKDFGVSEACLHRWLKIADPEDGGDPEGARAGGDLSAERRRSYDLVWTPDLLNRCAGAAGSSRTGRPSIIVATFLGTPPTTRPPNRRAAKRATPMTSSPGC